MGKKIIPCNIATIGSTIPKCPPMKRLYERFGNAYSPSGDVSCVGIGEPGCMGGFSDLYVRTYKWEQRAKKAKRFD